MTDTAIAYPTFVVSRLLAGTDTSESTYNAEDYWKRDFRFGPEWLEQARDGSPGVTLDFPRSHKQYDMFWAGMDVGITRYPSEMVILAEYTPTAAERRREERSGIAVPAEGQSRLKLLTRIRLAGFPAAIQASAVVAATRYYRTAAFALDSTGCGLGVAQLVERQAPSVVLGYHAAAEVVVAGIRRNAKEHATDVLRDLVDSKRLMLPYDADLLGQMTAETWHYSDVYADAYGQRRRVYSQSDEQGGLNALRIACFGWAMRAAGQEGVADV